MSKIIRCSYFILFLSCLLFFNSNIYAEKKLQPKKEIIDAKTSGIVCELITFKKINGQYVEQRQYFITNKYKQYIYLLKKVGDKEVDLTQFIGRKVIAKGKITVKKELTKYVDKLENSFLFTELLMLEIIEKK